jgi:hypothetical protein
MKALKRNWISFGLTCCLLAGVLTVNGANPADNTDLKNMYDLESIDNLDKMVEEIENVLSVNDRVQIYDSNDQLIAEGTKNDEKIKGYLGISDLLTEIDGIQYYRLSYK